MAAETDAAALPWPTDAPPRIDVVYTWVNGADPAHRAKVAKWSEVERPERASTAADRFASSDELLLSIKSVLKFADFVERIFIVTDEQDPRSHFADPALRSERIVVVDHREIFPDPSCLPTFDSKAIEACLHNIPGLSELFLYFNDDFFLLNPLGRADLLDASGRMILDCDKRDWMQWAFEEAGNLRRASVRNGVEAFRAAGLAARFFMPRHYPYLMSRSTLGRLHTVFPESMARTMRNRFRNRGSVWPVAMHHNLALQDGIAVRGREDHGIFFGHDAEEKLGDLHAHYFARVAEARFLCMNSWRTVSRKYPEIPADLRQRVETAG